MYCGFFVTVHTLRQLQAAAHKNMDNRAALLEEPLMKPLAKLLPEQLLLPETDPKGRYRLMADTVARWPLEERKAAPVAYMAG